MELVPPPRKTSPATVMLSILIAPLALAFFVVMWLSAGPKEAFKALTGRE